MNIALILSGGCGSRLGGNTPKQYIRVNGQLLITYCLKTFINHKDIDRIHIVCEEDYIDTIMTDLSDKGISSEKITAFSAPGLTRQLSILNGLRDIKNTLMDTNQLPDAMDPTIIIHDAARPNLTADDISDYLVALEDHDGLMPALPMKDTVYISENGSTISSLLDRSRVFAGQAPELYKLNKYLAANEALFPDEIMTINGSTEPAVLAGLDVTIVRGNENNYKITTQSDLEKFTACIS